MLGIEIYLSFFSKLQGVLLHYYKVTINNRAQTYIQLLFVFNYSNQHSN